MTTLIPWKRAELRNGSSHAIPIPRMLSDWDRMFGRFADDLWSSPMTSMSGIVLDVGETDEHVIVRAEVPGVDPTGLEISLAGDILTLSAEKIEAGELQNETRHLSERHFGAYRRDVKMPCPVDAQRIEATHKNGVVTVRLAKSEAVRPKKIEVKPA